MTTASPKIAAMFQLGKDAPPFALLNYPIIASRKLNGIRAMWFPPGHNLAPAGGFYSRRGVLYECMAHIRPSSPYVLDGEFYLHGTPLQEILGACAPNRQEPTPLTRQLSYHVFDVVLPNVSTTGRKCTAAQVTGEGVIKHDWYEARNANTLQYYYDDAIRDGYEGLMLQYPKTYYKPGRTMNIMKVKDWQFMTVTFVDFTPGEGKYEGALGAMIVEDGDGRRFKVGTGFDDEFREGGYIRKLSKRCTIQYLTKSVDSVPQNSSLVAFL